MPRTPIPGSTDRPLPSPQDVARRYPPDDGERLDVLAGAWAAAFYGSFVAFCVGWIPAWGFVSVGVVAFIRNFNALHEGFHARRTRDRAWWGRHLLVVTGPWMLGYDALKDNHRVHHQSPAEPGVDPDHYLASGPAWRALFGAVTQPEQALPRFATRRGLTRRNAWPVLAHFLVFSSIVVVGWGWPLVWWVVTTRAANAASWFIFDWCLHHPLRWGDDGPPELPGWLRAIWAVLLSRANLLGVEYHHVHHRYAFVPGTMLPELSKELRR